MLGGLRRGLDASDREFRTVIAALAGLKRDDLPDSKNQYLLMILTMAES